MRIACLQLAGRAGTGAPALARRSAAAALAASLGEVDLVVLPELWPVGFFAFDDYAASAEPLDGPTVEFAVGLAREHGCWVHGGSFVERGPQPEQLHNTSVLVDPAGEVALLYRKNHLFGYRSEEARLLTPGREAPVVTMSGSHEELRVGAATCYDLRFPELFRGLIDSGAELFCIASAWPAARLAHWRLLCQARAVENLAWLVACNAAGTEAGVELAGHSLVVDPWGTIVAEAGPEEQLLTADVDVGQARALREQYPFLADRRA